MIESEIGEQPTIREEAPRRDAGDAAFVKRIEAVPGERRLVEKAEAWW